MLLPPDPEYRREAAFILLIVGAALDLGRLREAQEVTTLLEARAEALAVTPIRVATQKEGV